MLNKIIQKIFTKLTNFKANPYHPLVWINGNPKIGKNVVISGFSEINANHANVTIGDNCDIASFVAINAADSHKYCLELSDEIERKDITIGRNVFIGSHCVVKGGANIGNYCVIGSGTIVDGIDIPDYSLVVGNPMIVKRGYYKSDCT
jgi:acetyltransferase-like isoleucine patch superfamily enzyme